MATKTKVNKALPKKISPRKKAARQKGSIRLTQWSEWKEGRLCADKA